jgi:hypothetical protein
MRHATPFLLIGCLLPAVAFGQVPAKLVYQGRLMGADGSPVAGVASMTFKLFKVETGGNEVWSETQPRVPLTGGFYSVLLGDVAALNPALFDGSDLFLELTIENSVLSPRQKIASVPYAIYAGSVAEVKTDSTLIGRGTSAAPLGIDAVHYGFTFEADACNTATPGTSVVVNDPTASSGKACEAAYGAAAGRMFGIHASDLGRLVAAQPSQVDFRLKVGANTSAAISSTAANYSGHLSWIAVGR